MQIHVNQWKCIYPNRNNHKLTQNHRNTPTHRQHNMTINTLTQTSACIDDARMMRETLSVGTISSAGEVRGYRRMYSGTMDCGRGLNFQHTPEHTKRIHVNSCESIDIHANQCKPMKTDNPCKCRQIQRSNTNSCKSIQNHVSTNKCKRIHIHSTNPNKSQQINTKIKQFENNTHTHTSQCRCMQIL